MLSFVHFTNCYIRGLKGYIQKKLTIEGFQIWWQAARKLAHFTAVQSEKHFKMIDKPAVYMYKVKSTSLAVADLGFPRGGAPTLRGGAPTYYSPNFSRKLHENEEILAEGEARPWHPPLDPPLPSLHT